MTEIERDFNRELYPFLYTDRDRDHDAMADAVGEARVSSRRKCSDIVALRQKLKDEYSDELVRASLAVADAFAKGGKLLSFGNGGSATDASDAAVDCLAPPVRHWRSLPAVSLCGDVGVITGVANDVGFDSVFSRQLIALGDPGDVAVAFTTSGRSPSVIAALREAKRRHMITVVLSGYDGGPAVSGQLADYSFIARLDYTPRIQEGHATVWHSMLELIHVVLGDSTLGGAA